MVIPRKYGWVKDHPDLNKSFYGVEISPLAPIANMPKQVDITAMFPSAYNQLQLNSCTANAGAALVQFHIPNFTPSRLFLYYNARKTDGDINQDNGSTLSTINYAIKVYGICPESDWPYYTNDVFVSPNPTCYQNGLKCQETLAYAIQGIDEMKHCLATGLPFMFGFSVYSYFESENMAANPILRLPTNQEQYMGGHAVVAVGFDDDKQLFKIRNSWGEEWGDHGYFYMPYDYITNANLASDFWAIIKVELANK